MRDPRYKHEYLDDRVQSWVTITEEWRRRNTVEILKSGRVFGFGYRPFHPNVDFLSIWVVHIWVERSVHSIKAHNSSAPCMFCLFEWEWVLLISIMMLIVLYVVYNDFVVKSPSLTSWAPPPTMWAVWLCFMLAKVFLKKAADWFLKRVPQLSSSAATLSS